MRVRGICIFVLAAAVLGAGMACNAAENTLLDRAREAMRKAGEFWAGKVASHGGYVWVYSTDLLSHRRGESQDLPLTTNWVQPPGTPSVGMAFLRAYEATGEKACLDAALAAGRCLAWGQLACGGWDYSIEFDPKRNRNLYHHLKTDAPGAASLRNTATFDDNNTQSATCLLMELDRHADDAEVDAAVQRAMKCFLDAQYKGSLWDGAWPQRYPPPKGYGAYPTYNDNTMTDCVQTMLKAYKQYGKPEYIESVKKCLEFYLRSQLPEPQAAWAQQYDENLKPAWARRFEPPAVTGGESVGNVRLLLEMYIEFGDQRYLDAAGKALDWFKRSRIGGTEEAGVWARFYEPGTNKPLYFTKTYQLVYTDDDLPVHYSFKGNYGVSRYRARYEEIRKNGRQRFLEQRDRKPTPAERAERAAALTSRVEEILKTLDDQGRWVKAEPKREQVRDKEGRVGYEVDEKVKLNLMYSQTFISHMQTLADYVTAAQGGPKVVTQ